MTTSHRDDLFFGAVRFRSTMRREQRVQKVLRWLWSRGYYPTPTRMNILLHGHRSDNINSVESRERKRFMREMHIPHLRKRRVPSTTDTERVKVRVTLVFDVAVPAGLDRDTLKFAIEENSCPASGPYVGATFDAIRRAHDADGTCWGCALQGQNEIIE